MPADIQEKMLRSIPGLEDVEMIRPGYGVEYDCVDARELKRMSIRLTRNIQLPNVASFIATLETKRIPVRTSKLVVCELVLMRFSLCSGSFPSRTNQWYIMISWDPFVALSHTLNRNNWL